MITADLISYIRRQQDNNVSRDLIISNLKNVGWHPEDIEEGFNKIEQIRLKEGNAFSNNQKEDGYFTKQDSQDFSLSDKYREPVALDEEPIAKKEVPFVEKKKETFFSKKDDSILVSNKVEQSSDLISESLKEEKTENLTIEDILEPTLPPKKELVDVVNPFNMIIERNEVNQGEYFSQNTDLLNKPSEEKPIEPTKEIEETKETPVLGAIMPTEEKPTEEKQPLDANISNSVLQEVIQEKPTTSEEPPVVENAGLEAIQNLKNILSQPEEIKENISQDTEKEPLVEPVLSAAALEEPEEAKKVWLPKNIPIKEIVEPEPEETEIVVQNLELESGKSPEVVELKNEITPEEDKNYALNNLPKISSISTYQKDRIEILNQLEQEKSLNTPKRFVSKKTIKWIAVFLLGALVVGGIVWALMTGKIDLKNINIPFINKDPRSLILSNSKILSSLDSYKVETSLELSTPSFASISAGLLTGEAVNSLDRDNLIMNSSSLVSQKDGKLKSDNVIIVNGSVLENIINAKIQNDGESLYLNFPDLSNVLKEPSPLFGSVKINEQEFYLVPSLFGPKTEKVLSKVNLYSVLSSGISSYIDQETLGTYDELVKKVQITKRGEESIKGVSTYHYGINPDKQLFKDLLTKIVNRFSFELSEQDKANADLLISSAEISSFDVWIGKGDNTIYQYSVVLQIPMTKVLGFEDKSVGDNTMSVSLKVTYFDFNVENEISAPSDYTDINDFVKNSKIENVKNKVKEFFALAENLKKIEKKYGATSNSKGSCMSPVLGSLFSPTGHPKSAVMPVSEISSFLNYVLGLTKGSGTCYSTQTGWSFAVPLSDSYENIATSESFDKYYCIDSKGNDIEITSLPKGSICEQKLDTKPLVEGV